MTTMLQSAELIALEISSRLAAIRVANGCETDIGATVYRGKRKVEDDAAPCAVLVEGADTVTDRPGKLPAAKIEQGYVLGGYVPCDADNPNDAAHALIRDLKRAIFKDGGTFGGKVVSVNYKGRDIGPRTDGVAIVFALIEISVTYVESLVNP